MNKHITQHLDLSNLLDTGTFVIVSGDDPRFEAEVADPSTSRLINELERAEYGYVEVRGKYHGQTENSVLIFTDRPYMLGQIIAEKYGQEFYVVSHNGQAELVFTKTQTSIPNRQTHIFNNGDAPTDNVTIIPGLDKSFIYIF